MFTAYAIILANIFVTFPLAFGVIKPVFDTMSRSLERSLGDDWRDAMANFLARDPPKS